MLSYRSHPNALKCGGENSRAPNHQIKTVNTPHIQRRKRRHALSCARFLVPRPNSTKTRPIHQSPTRSSRECFILHTMPG